TACIGNTAADMFRGEGGLATAATLNPPQGVAVYIAGNVYFSDSIKNRIVKVLAQQPSFQDLPAVILSAPSGGKTLIETRKVSVTVSPQSGIPVPGMPFSVQVSSNTPWLTVSPQTGNTPGSLTIRVDPSNLSAGPYSGSATVRVPLANPPVRVIDVQF